MSLVSLLGAAHVPSSFTVCGSVAQSEFTRSPARRIKTEGGELSEAVSHLVDLQESLSGGNLDIFPVLRCLG